MVETFISKSGEGKSACILIEAAKQKDKSVAFISFEMTTQEIMRRLDCINPTAKEITVFTPSGNEKTLSVWLKDKLNQLAEKFDIICIDTVDLAASGNSVFKLSDYEEINQACFGGFMTQCESLWISQNVHRKMNYGENYAESVASIESFEIEGLLKVKQICRKIEHPLLPGVSLIESVDLITNEIKIYNLSKIFKNK